MIAWIKKNWKTVLKWAAVLLGIAAAVEIVARTLASITEKVQAPRTFTPDPTDNTRVLVKTDGGWVSGKLPAGQTADKVTAAGLTPAGTVEVEIAHPVTDRSSAPPAAPGSGMGIKSGS